MIMIMIMLMIMMMIFNDVDGINCAPLNSVFVMGLIQ